MSSLKYSNKGIIFLLLSVFCYSVMGIFIRFLGNEIPPFSQVFLRYIVASILSIGFAIHKKTSFKIHSVLDLLVFMIMGILGYGLSNAFFTLGILNTTFANTLYLFSTYIIFTPILALLLLREKISKKIIYSLLLCTIGIYLLIQPQTHGVGAGEYFAIISSFLYSVYFIGRRRLYKYPSIIIMVYSTILGVITTGFISIFRDFSFYFPKDLNSGSIRSISLSAWIITLIFGMDNFLAWYFLNKGLKEIKTGLASIIMSLEPALASIIGIFIYKEIPNITAFIGMMLITLGVIKTTKK